jgi:hypothetical protein
MNKNAFTDGMLDYVIRAKMLDENIREALRNALLLKHVHQHEKEYHKLTSNGSGDKKSFHFVKSLADMGKKLSHIDLNNSRKFACLYLLFKVYKISRKSGKTNFLLIKIKFLYFFKFLTKIKIK